MCFYQFLLCALSPRPVSGLLYGGGTELVVQLNRLGFSDEMDAVRGYSMKFFIESRPVLSEDT